MNTRFTAARKRMFVERLLRWFSTAKRPFPWREAYSPYGVWISEIMLQQTQAERGEAYYKKWMKLFPDIHSVADAREEEVLAAWEGLGYYSRARNLRLAAKRIVAEHGGEFPGSYDAIRALPGVGDYTAGAIAAIAFNLPEPAVDANVLRIFSRICDIDAPVARKDVREAVTALARALIPNDSPRLFNQALMELGALVCGKTPRCGDCPVSACCDAFRAGTVSERPRKTAKAGYTTLEMVAGIIRFKGKVLIRQRPPGGLWAGLWEFPNRPALSDERPEQTLVGALAEEFDLSIAIREKIATVRHGFTTNRVILHGYLCDALGVPHPPSAKETEWQWVASEECARYAFPAGHRKLLERLGWKRTGEAAGRRQ